MLSCARDKWLFDRFVAQAALGIISFLKVDLFHLFDRCHNGLAAIREEWETAGTAEDQECMKYVLDQPAGSSTTQFANGLRDQGRNGEFLRDFVDKPESKVAELNIAHVAALRLYTTHCFHSINNPLRDVSSQAPHPFPVTVFFLTDAIKRLRAVHAESKRDGDQKRGSKEGQPMLNLWRGMRNLKTGATFHLEGGSELAPMSTTSNLAVAVAYGQSADTLLFKIICKNFMMCGADISYLSCFTNEKEYLFPPLTYLSPTGRPPETVRVQVHDDQSTGSKGKTLKFNVLEVEPVM